MGAVPRGSSAILFLALLLLAGALRAGTVRWTPIGPDGGGVAALAFSADGRTAWAGTRAGGAFRSANAGRTWSRIASLPGEVRSLAGDPAAASRAWAATSEGVFRSDDSGLTWRSVSSGLPLDGPGLPGATQVVVEPTAGHAVWAVAGGIPYRSTDRGTSWRPAMDGLTGPVEQLAPHPRRAGALFAATIFGVFRSGDSGRLWRPTPIRSWTRRVVFDPLRPAHVYAFLFDSETAESTIWLSDDNGVTWSQGGIGYSGFGTQADLVADPLHAGHAWAATGKGFRDGLFRTTDGGLHWQGTHELPGFQSLAPSPARSGLVLAGRADDPVSTAEKSAVVRSVDGGGTWTAAGAGLSAQDVVQVAADPAVAGLLYARASCCTLWKREAADRGWGRIGTNLPLEGLTGLAIDPRTPSTLYEGTVETAFKSTNAGRSWRSLDSPILAALAVDPARPATVYGAQLFPAGLARSDDAGFSWRALPAAVGLFADVVVATPGAVYANGFPAYGDYRDRVRRSTDRGATWTTLLALPLPQAKVRDVAVDPRSPARLWAAVVELDSGFHPVAGGVWRSMDGGAHWAEARPGGGRPVFALAVDPRDAARLWAATDRGAVFQSEDGGATWAPYGEGLPPADVYDLEIDPFDSDTLYAATRGGSVYAFTRSR